MEEIKHTLRFTYADFEDFVKYAMDIAPICALANWDGKRSIIMRHDVDFDIPSAYKLAKMEKKIGIQSTFFIMTTNRYYNPLFPANSDLLRSMSNDGFEIGLHFDPSIYENASHQELENKVKLECSILESIIGKPIRSISLHNPSLSGQYPMFEGYINAYSNEIFSDDNYMSDSCMDFRGKNPYEFVKKAKDSTLQIVFHPMHWSEEGLDYIGFFTKFINNLTDNIDETFRANRTYKKIIGEDRLKDKIRGEEYD
ncbi:MAG: hypothetical protein FP824_06295 [Euryarchaeota archaeon]|nr:hypothetical protein [Euryarchaeota archaeon]MBU4032161.1 hypothetical protein [Candidatus Thermoplasmatota archaeon]MBU4072297.1 hypothetical protein [Candidatus Thermoplasmatota archaeon]MBU4143855.1 hypothetical protein [Candidatus Thermoplasmatota archaeon]